MPRFRIAPPKADLRGIGGKAKAGVRFPGPAAGGEEFADEQALQDDDCDCRNNPAWMFLPEGWGVETHFCAARRVFNSPALHLPGIENQPGRVRWQDADTFRLFSRENASDYLPEDESVLLKRRYTDAEDARANISIVRPDYRHS